MVNDPYLPNIIKDVVDRVNTFFLAQDPDPFEVKFGKGLYTQVGNDLFAEGELFLMAWMMMPFDLVPPQHEGYFKDGRCDMLFAIPTDPNYTQQQREDINYHPKLIPVLNKFFEEIKAEERFGLPDKISFEKETYLPYWGGGDISAPGAPNLWKGHADCIKITGLKVRLEHPRCEPDTFSTF